MAWTTPVTPLSGTTITVAWAVTTIVNNLSWLRGLTGAADPPAADRVIRSTSTTATEWGQVKTAMIEDAAITVAKIFDNTITENKIANGTIIESKLNSAVTVKLVPSGLIAAFRTAATIPSGWSRFTDGDGRVLVGAGTTFSQTFTENTAAGSNWTPVTGLTASTVGASTDPDAGASAGGLNLEPLNHTHPGPTINGQGAAWLPPSRVVVYAIKS